MATAPQGLTARLKPEEVIKYKRAHEDACATHAHNVARGRTAFFMVDYKNVERVYQLYSQLTKEERLRAVETLTSELKAEAVLREEQGFSVSIEPTIDWNEDTEGILGLVPTGVIHPAYFTEVEPHPACKWLPNDFPQKGDHDIWIQLLVRVLLTCRPALSLDDLMKLEEPAEAGLAGRLVAISGNVKGKFFDIDEYEKRPVVQTAFVASSDIAVWRSELNLKTHYIYSDTAAQALRSGRMHGLVVLRDIVAVKKRGERVIVDFSCTPLILGGGSELRVS